MTQADINALIRDLEMAGYDLMYDHSNMAYPKLVVYNNIGVDLYELEEIAQYYGATASDGANGMRATIYL